MKRSKFSDSQIIDAVKRVESGKFEVFFDDIYFDMSGQEPVIQKIPTKND
jgi:hypothetical protein